MVSRFFLLFLALTATHAGDALAATYYTSADVGLVAAGFNRVGLIAANPTMNTIASIIWAIGMPFLFLRMQIGSGYMMMVANRFIIQYIGGLLVGIVGLAIVPLTVCGTSTNICAVVPTSDIVAKLASYGSAISQGVIHTIDTAGEGSSWARSAGGRGVRLLLKASRMPFSVPDAGIPQTINKYVMDCVVAEMNQAVPQITTTMLLKSSGDFLGVLKKANNPAIMTTFYSDSGGMAAGVPMTCKTAYDGIEAYLSLPDVWKDQLNSLCSSSGYRVNALTGIPSELAGIIPTSMIASELAECKSVLEYYVANISSRADFGSAFTAQSFLMHMQVAALTQDALTSGGTNALQNYSLATTALSSFEAFEDDWAALTIENMVQWVSGLTVILVLLWATPIFPKVFLFQVGLWATLCIWQMLDAYAHLSAVEAAKYVMDSLPPGVGMEWTSTLPNAAAKSMMIWINNRPTAFMLSVAITSTLGLVGGHALAMLGGGILSGITSAAASAGQAALTPSGVGAGLSDIHQNSAIHGSVNNLLSPDQQAQGKQGNSVAGMTSPLGFGSNGNFVDKGAIDSARSAGALNGQLQADGESVAVTGAGPGDAVRKSAELNAHVSAASATGSAAFKEAQAAGLDETVTDTSIAQNGGGNFGSIAAEATENSLFQDTLPTGTGMEGSDGNLTFSGHKVLDADGVKDTLAEMEAQGLKNDSSYKTLSDIQKTMGDGDGVMMNIVGKNGGAIPTLTFKAEQSASASNTGKVDEGSTTNIGDVTNVGDTENRVMDKAEFGKWLADNKDQFAGTDPYEAAEAKFAKMGDGDIINVKTNGKDGRLSSFNIGNESTYKDVSTASTIKGTSYSDTTVVDAATLEQAALSKDPADDVGAFSVVANPDGSWNDAVAADQVSKLTSILDSRVSKSLTKTESSNQGKTDTATLGIKIAGAGLVSARTNSFVAGEGKSTSVNANRLLAQQMQDTARSNRTVDGKLDRVAYSHDMATATKNLIEQKEAAANNLNNPAHAGDHTLTGLIETNLSKIDSKAAMEDSEQMKAVNKAFSLYGGPDKS